MRSLIPERDLITSQIKECASASKWVSFFLKEKRKATRTTAHQRVPNDIKNVCSSNWSSWHNSIDVPNMNLFNILKKNLVIYCIN